MSASFNPDWMPEPALYSKQQAAVFLGVGVRTIEVLLANKQLVRRKIGSRTLIPLSSLRAFLTKDHATRKENGETK